VGETGIGVGVIVGVSLMPGVRDGDGVNVGVRVGGSVGIICTADAPQPLMSSARTGTIMKRKDREAQRFIIKACVIVSNFSSSITCSAYGCGRISK
jgi:hypothetical protein